MDEQQQVNVLSPFLVKVEVLLVLVTVLLASVAWLLWEIFSFVQREGEEANPDWWEALKNCPHRRLIIPPSCVEEVPELGALSRLTTATSNAVKNMKGVVSSSIQRTSNLISGGGSKPLSKAAKKASRQDLAAAAAAPADAAGGTAGDDRDGVAASPAGTTGRRGGRVRRRGSRQQLAGMDAGHKPKPHKLDLAAESDQSSLSSSSSSMSGSPLRATPGGGGGHMMADVVRAIPRRRGAAKSDPTAAASASPGASPATRGRMRFLTQQQGQQQQGQQASALPPPGSSAGKRGGGGGSKLASPPAIAMPEARAVHVVDAATAAAAGAGPSPSGASPPVLKGEAIVTPAQQQQAQAQAAASGSASAATAAGGAGAGGLGYIFHPIPEDCTPLLAFVNSRSGVSQGAYLIHQLRRLLNPIQVVDLANEDPARALKQFMVLPRLRILVCGGDGTAKWIMGCLEELEIDCWPPIAILPLGTGNDMARVLGWGGGYNNESLVELLAQVQRAHVVVVDRWALEITSGKGGGGRGATKARTVPFQNYFGVGVDAQAALKFHHLRESKPQLFFNRVVNKLFYGAMGFQDLFRRSCENLPCHLKIVADGRELRLPKHVQGVIFLNIESYGGGVRLWSVHDDGEEGQSLDGYEEDDEASDPGSSGGGVLGGLGGGGDDDDAASWRTEQSLHSASMQDGMLEVVAVTGVVHLGQLQVGLSKAIKIAQCREAVITTGKDLPMQVDGEPWPQPKGTIRILKKEEPAYMLKRTMDSGGAVIGETAELLDWALTDGVITLQQKKTLLTEFSRRVEAKRKIFASELAAAGSTDGGVPTITKNFDVTRLRLAPDAHPTDCAVM